MTNKQLIIMLCHIIIQVIFILIDVSILMSGTIEVKHIIMSFIAVALGVIGNMLLKSESSSKQDNDVEFNPKDIKVSKTIQYNINGKENDNDV